MHMNRYGRAAIAASVLSALSLSTAAQAADAACDRVCLVVIAQKYLTAMVNHKPADAPLANNVSFTENSMPAKLGEGSWQAAKGVRPQRQYVTDLKTGQVGVMAVLDGVDDQFHVFAARLKVANNQITEIETLWSRDGESGPAFAPELYMYREPAFVREVPVKHRSSRAELTKTVDKYWDTVTGSHDGYTIPYGSDCSRFENGANVSWEQELNDNQKKQREEDPKRNAFIPDEENGRIWGCAREATLSTRAWKSATDRHYVIDEDRGLVMSFVKVDTNNDSGAPAFLEAAGMGAGGAPNGAPPGDGMGGGAPAGGPPGGGPPGGMGAGPGGENNPLRPGQIGSMITTAKVMGAGPPGMSTKGSQMTMINATVTQAQLNWIVDGKIRRENVFYHTTSKNKQ
jgi:hypothetical protein